MKNNKLILFFLVSSYMIIPSCNQKIKKEMMVSTGNVTEITITTAKVSGQILDLGGGATTCGHCYATNAHPTVSGMKFELDNPVVGKYISNLTGLATSTKYYVRAYLSRGSEVVYGSDSSFTTLSDAQPSLTTTAVTEIHETTAISGGNITSQGGTPVTARGVCWSLSTNPTVVLTTKTSDGSGIGIFFSNLTGLTGGTKYYLRAYATNAGNTGYGNEVSFTTSSATTVPIVTTAAVKSFTANSAVCGGEVTSEGGGTVTAKGVCWSTGQNPTIINGSTTIDGSGTGGFVSNITGLNPGTKYYIRAYATNSAGTGYGTETNFITNSILPTLTTIAINSITSTTAGSGGNITSDGGAAITARGVCWSTSSNPTIAYNYTNDATGNGTFTSSLTGLTGNTTYHVRAYATNSQGTVYGNELTFTTLNYPPDAITESASGISSTTATLNGTVNANSFSTTVSFEYGTTISYGNSISATPNSVTGSVNIAVSAGLTGLTTNTLYHFRVKAVNSGGITYGLDQTFTTNCTEPTASTNTPTSINISTATLNGTVNANNFSTTVSFEYGTTISYGNSISATPNSVTGSVNTAVSAGLTGLTTNTLYHFRVKSVNCGGIVYSNDRTFSTPCTAPIAATNAATNGSNTATLNGLVNANNGSTVVTFEYGLTISYGNSITATTSPVTGTTNTSVSAGITALIPNSLYHNRVKAVNCGGTAYGADNTFNTNCLAPNATTGSSIPNSPYGNTATLYGSVNANNGSTEVTFEYGLTTSYGSSITATPSLVTGTANTPVSAIIYVSGSSPFGIKYHYRIKAVNCGGTSYGGDKNFLQGAK